ncbi:MAG TPA: PAS domain S-box protein [Thermodesulfovibrionales bacterium]|nr:PAS domain S-box protein [Thermodesulfovibrionales bacterium]
MKKTKPRICKQPGKKPADPLRRRAETLVRKRHGDGKLERLSDESALCLIHELQTHQIELELQNEELRQAQYNLEEARTKYADLYDFAPVGYFTLDKNGFILETNLTGASMLGFERRKILGRPFIGYVKRGYVKRGYVKRGYSDIFGDHIREVIKTGKPQTCELGLTRKDGTDFAAALESVLSAGQTIRTVMIDVRERMRTEDALRESEERFRLIAESSTDVIFQVDRDGRLVYCSPSAQLYGFDSTRVGGMSFERFFEPGEFLKARETLQKVLSGERLSLLDFKMQRADGTPMDVEISVSPVTKDGIIVGVQGVARDVTERREMECALLAAKDELEARVQERTEELKRSEESLRNLTAHLEAVREEERAHIAREIHDELGQSLTALKMDVSWLGNKYKDHDTVFEKTKSMSDMIDETIMTVQKIISELRPSILDTLGTVAAIEWLAGEFHRRVGIPCKVSFSRGHIDLDKDRSTAVFRVFQEALTNVARHAKATRVEASVKWGDDIILTVKDNGKGITKERLSDPESFGLIGMRERVKFFGGEIDIRGRADKGTTVTMRMPLAQEK